LNLYPAVWTFQDKSRRVFSSLHFKDLLKEAQTFFFFFWEVQQQTRPDNLLALPSQAHYSRRPA